MNFCGLAMQAPILGLPRTRGSDSGLIFFSRARPLAPITSPVMSGTTAERSRILPSLSSMPGFSLPTGPYRRSFISCPPSVVICEWRKMTMNAHKSKAFAPSPQLGEGRASDG